jgi:hypothetical protein
MKKLLSLFVILLAISCSDTDDVVNPTTIQTPVDIYVAGVKNFNATYWKNNQEFLLADGDGAEADTIIVSNNNVHVLGKKQFDNWTTEHLYWKNNVFTNISTSFSTPDQVVKTITGIDVVGDDVYIVGYTKNPLITAEIYDLVYWKNGVKTVVGTLNHFSTRSKIKVFNNTVYITAMNNNFESGLYINDVFQIVSNDLVLRGVTIKNNEVFVYGTKYLSSSTVAFIKNISTNVETTFSNIAGIHKMIFDNSNTYISDGSNVFKNNLVLSSSSFFSFYIDFEILDDKLYILKREGDFGTSDTLYINDVNALQIFVNEGKFNTVTVVQN